MTTERKLWWATNFFIWSSAIALVLVAAAHFIGYMTGGLVATGSAFILTLINGLVLHRYKSRVQNQSRDGSINELAASIASKLARNAPIDPEPSDPPKGDGLICQSQREDDKISPPREATTVMHNQPPYRKESSDEYRERADACLNWAQEASTDEVRLACLTLAKAWLKAAMSEDGGEPDHLPLAPKL